MLRSTGLGCGLLILLLWATGCRDEQVAFRFQRTVPQSIVLASTEVAAEISGEAAGPAGRVVAEAPASLFPRLKYESRRAPFNRRTSSSSLSARVFPPRKRPTCPPACVVLKPERAIDDSSWDGILFLLGGAICVTAVFIGLKLGSGLGLLIAIPVYVGGAYMIARGYGGPNKLASARPPSALQRLRRRLANIRNWQRLKLARSSAPPTSLGEITFTVGTLMMLVALVLGITGVLSGNAALLMGIVSMLLAGAAYGGVK